MVLGSKVYFLFLNPGPFEQAGIFRFASASVPAFLVAGIVHFLLTKLVVQPLGKGGYVQLEEAGGENWSRQTLY